MPGGFEGQELQKSQDFCRNIYGYWSRNIDGALYGKLDPTLTVFSKYYSLIWNLIAHYGLTKN